MDDAAAIIVAAGSGERFENPGKAFIPLGDWPLVRYSIENAVAAVEISLVVVVAGSHTLVQALELAHEEQFPKNMLIIEGGARRQDSVRAGLKSLGPAIKWVLVQDAARPFAPPYLFSHCLARARATGAAIAAIPVTDTIKEVDDLRVVRTVPRERLWAAQTPQAFSREGLCSAFAEADRRGLEVTDEASLYEALGWPVEIVPSSPLNLKITTPADLAVAEAMLASRELFPGSDT